MTYKLAESAKPAQWAVFANKDATNFCQAEHRAEPWGISPTYLETGHWIAKNASTKGQ
jgi:hypothetical protein